MKVLFICFADFGRADSGSSVRPQKMYRAFVEAGHEVKLLCGSDGNDCRAERRKSVAEINRWLDIERPDICYIESPVGQIMLDDDIRLIKRLHSMGIPTGYFIRDYYRKFPELFPRRKGFINTLKELYLDIRQAKTDKALKCVDIVYLSSEQGKALFPYKDMRLLPPAGENHLPTDKKFSKTGIYVGGISDIYGVDILLDAYGIVNGAGEEYRLILVTRNSEWNAFEHPLKNAPWLEVHHVSGAELEPLYERASVAMAPKRSDAYNKIAISIKIFEYMGYGLPIIAADEQAIDSIIESYDLGIVARNTPEGFALAIREIFADKERYQQYRENGKKALLKENLWMHRVDKVVCDLSEYRNKNQLGTMKR